MKDDVTRARYGVIDSKGDFIGRHALRAASVVQI